MAKVLVIGSGGREQALAWKIAQSAEVDNVFIAPGNAGSRGKITNVNIDFLDGPKLLEFAKKEAIDLTVIGQESASEAGVVDLFKESGLTIFGPTKAAIKIESSKTYSKDIMKRQNIPTAEYQNFSDPELALDYAKSRPLPVVIKADGLAAGKGVVIAENVQQIEDAINDIMVQKSFGGSGSKVVIEDFLKGQEVSMHALSDGKTAIMFPTSQDHKQIFDGDKGPNTGGMGVIAPVEWVSDEIVEEVKGKVVEPALLGLSQDGSEFSGVLYPGLMVDGDQLKVLEFNGRFGDPEAEVYMRLIDCDLYQVLYDCAKGSLDAESVKWKPGFAVTIILASKGYPGSYQKGDIITGIEAAESMDDIVVFHAGTKINEHGNLVTSGGRVLNVTATASKLEDALTKAYAAVEKIHFEGMQYRKDIGKRPPAIN